MSLCINKNTVEFQALKNLSGLPDFYLAAVCADFVEKHDRFPYLDEIPGSNSTNYLSKLLGLKHGGTQKSKILEMTGTLSLGEAQVSINTTFPDIEVRITPLENEAMVDIRRRPENKPISEKIEHSNLSNSALLFDSIIYKLLSLYGIQLNSINSEDILSSELKNIPGVANASAFVYNNLVYINNDLSDKDAPVHEMMHILMGSFKMSNPKQYYQISDWVSKLPIFAYYQELYPNRTRSDVAEEAFVGEFSKMVSGVESTLQNFPNKVKYELFYHAKRVLDSILMGETSIKNFPDAIIFNLSLTELCDLVNSTLDVSTFPATISLENGEAHRLLSNKKHELLENNELEEHCNV